MAIHYVEQDGAGPSTHKSSTPQPIIPNEEGHEHTASETSDPLPNDSEPTSPEASDDEEEEPKWALRPDRLYQKPNKHNAQGHFPPSSCVFVGNLSIRVSVQQLDAALTPLISKYGTCHVRVKIANKGILPVAFVQFEERKCAKLALKQNGKLILHNRVLRLEISNARRTAFFGLLSDAPISEEELLAVLQNWGSLQKVTIQRFVHREGFNSSFGVVTFVFPDDYSEALEYFENDYKYYLIRAEMDPNHTLLTPDYPPPEHRSANQASQHRGNQQRYNGNRRPYHRPWYSGNSRGGYRGAPGGGHRHQNPSFSSNGQAHSPQGSVTSNHPGGNSLPQNYVGNNFNQGYPNNVYPQPYPGNGFSPSYPSPNFVPPGGFSGPPVMFNQMPMADVPPPMYPSEFTPMPSPGYPIFIGSPSFQPPSPLPPIVTQPQDVPGPIARRRRLPPRPDCPLIVSSQPQYDTDEHMRLYYEPYPATEPFTGIQPAWYGPAGGGYMQPCYNQPYPPGGGYPHSRQSSMGSRENINSPPKGDGSESALAQTKVDSEETERGRHLTRTHHANTDGSSDMAPVADAVQKKSNPISMRADIQAELQATDVTGPTEIQNHPAAPVNEPQSCEPQKKINESEEAPTAPLTEPIHAAASDHENEVPIDKVGHIDFKNEESTGSSSEAGPKTPDTEQSRERVGVQTPAPAESVMSTETKTTDTAETPKPAEVVTSDNGKGKEPAASTPTKSGNSKLEPAVPDDKHLLARHAFQHRKPLKKKYQPKIDTGKTVEKYTREINAQRAANDPDSRVPEHLLQEVIQELENERKENARKSQGLEPNDKSSIGSDTSSKN